MRSYGWNESDEYKDPEYAELKAEDTARRRGMIYCEECETYYFRKDGHDCMSESEK